VAADSAAERVEQASLPAFDDVFRQVVEAGSGSKLVDVRRSARGHGGRLAPTGSQRRAHPDGELAAARAAADAGRLMAVSMGADFSLEDVRQAAARPLWFQIMMPRDREVVRVLVEVWRTPATRS
jgi:hypothetical protein